MNRLAFLRAYACARGCVWCGLQVFFFYCWVIFPNDEGGAPYMEMGILPFFLLRVVDTEEEKEEEEVVVVVVMVITPPLPPP